MPNWPFTKFITKLHAFDGRGWKTDAEAVPVIHSSGVYIAFGTTPDGQASAYVGQSVRLINRLCGANVAGGRFPDQYGVVAIPCSEDGDKNQLIACERLMMAMLNFKCEGLLHSMYGRRHTTEQCRDEAAAWLWAVAPHLSQLADLPFALCRRDLLEFSRNSTSKEAGSLQRYLDRMLLALA